MKIRTDFVTNSSSASYILEIVFENDVGVREDLSIFNGECEGHIDLIPQQAQNDILFSGKSIYSAKNITELCNLLATSIDGMPSNVDADCEECEELTFVITGKLKHYENREELTEIIEDLGGIVSGSVTKKTDYLINNDCNSESAKNKKAIELGVPIITELQFIKMFDEEKFYELVEEGVFDEFTFAELEQEKFSLLKANCENRGITIDNLRKIIIKKKRDGYGDSAMWIESIAWKNEVTDGFIKQYKDAADEDGRKAIIDEMVKFIHSAPEMEVCDNEGGFGAAICVWNGKDAELKEIIKKYFSGELPSGWWMCTYSKEYSIDVSGKKVSYREVMYYGDQYNLHK